MAVPARRSAVVALAASMLVLTSLVATAQENRNRDLIDLGPLTRVIDGFTEGREVAGLFVEPNALGGDAIVSQFQVMANLGSTPVFGEEDVEYTATGVTASEDLQMVSLAAQFGGPLDHFDRVPPLAPFWRDQEGMDLTPVFDGWSGYDQDGPIAGPIRILEPMQAIAGVELAEPFDTTCTSPTFVGRAWAGATTSGSDPLFTFDALSERYAGDSHGVLAERASRIVELMCLPGADPVVLSLRMKDDRVSAFGPTGAVALVKDNFVVLFAPVRTLDSDLRQQFFASTQGGGAVAVSNPLPAPEDLVLVPNPYGDGDISADLIVDLPTEGAAAVLTLQARTPIADFALAGQVGAQSGGECVPSAGDLIFLGAIGGGYARRLSTLSTQEQLSFIRIQNLDFEYPNGDSDRFEIDPSDRSFTAEVTKGGQTCTATGQLATSGLLPGEVEGEDSSGSDTDSGGTEVDSGTTGSPGSEVDAGAAGDDQPATDDGGGGGLPWGPIGGGLLVLAGVGGYAATRTRAKRDCEPERQAYAAADAAYDPAKRASDYYRGEYEHYRSEYRSYELQLENRLPEPDRLLGFPEGAEGDAAYAEAVADWQRQEADAERAAHNLEGARQATEAARAESEQADAALDAAREALEAARIALMNCQGSAPAGPGDDEVTTGTGLPGTLSPPSEPADPQPSCQEGTTKVVVESQAQFQILGGPVQIDVPTSAWTGASNGGAITAANLADLDQSDLEELFADLDNRVAAVITSATIPTKILTVKCIRIHVCSGGRWVETEQTNRVEETAAGPNISIRERSKDKKLTARMVAKAQAKVAELQANESEAGSYSCD